MYSDDELILKRIWDSEQNWYKTQDVLIREEEEKWSVDMREKYMKLTSLESSESSLKYIIDMLNKHEVIILISCYTLKFFFFRPDDCKETIITEITRTGLFQKTHHRFGTAT